MKEVLGLFLIVSMVVMLFSCGQKQAVQNEIKEVKNDVVLSDDKTSEVVHTDYSDMNNWLINEYNEESKKNSKADVIFFYGTCVNEEDQENGVVNIEGEMREKAPLMAYTSVSVFNDDSTRIFMPFYRQISLFYALKGKDHEALLNSMKNSEVAIDLYDSLDYYFKNFNNGRPFIIAGYSQGGAAVQVALEKFFGKEENKKYLKQLVIAYSIAYGVDKNWLNKLDYIKFAEGPTDTGVLASWVTEGAGCTNEPSMLLANNSADTLIINPINWKRDDTYAKAEECLSSLVIDPETNETKEVKPGIYNLQINLKRGVLVCDNNTDYMSINGEYIWGGKSLHLYETKEAYGSIKKNMNDRLEAFLKKE